MHFDICLLQAFRFDFKNWQGNLQGAEMPCRIQVRLIATLLVGTYMCVQSWTAQPICWDLVQAEEAASTLHFFIILVHAWLIIGCWSGPDVALQQSIEQLTDSDVNELQSVDAE